MQPKTIPQAYKRNHVMPSDPTRYLLHNIVCPLLHTPNIALTTVSFHSDIPSSVFAAICQVLQQTEEMLLTIISQMEAFVQEYTRARILPFTQFTEYLSWFAGVFVTHFKLATIIYKGKYLWNHESGVCNHVEKMCTIRDGCIAYIQQICSQFRLLHMSGVYEDKYTVIREWKEGLVTLSLLVIL